jgi:hypothetical protein
LSKNCVFPPELDEKQLLLYLDGEANREILSHLERCAHCREKAETLDRLQKRLTTRLYRLTCPPTIELGEYHLRLLPAAQMLVVAQHVRECPHCSREVLQLEGFLGDLMSTSEDSLLGKAKVLIARLVGGQAEPGEQGEIGLAPVVPALRGEARGPLTFEVDGVVIILDIQPANQERADLLGQVAADHQEQWTGALVELREGGELEFSANVDDLGAFHSESIIPGPKELRITPMGGSVVVVMNFELSI